MKGSRPVFASCRPNGKSQKRFLDEIASPSSYPCQSVSGSVIDSFRFGDSYRISELCELVLFLHILSNFFLRYPGIVVQISPIFLFGMVSRKKGQWWTALGLLKRYHCEPISEGETIQSLFLSPINWTSSGGYKWMKCMKWNDGG